MSKKLDSFEIQAGLDQLDKNWAVNDTNDVIQRNFLFDNYLQTMAFANAVAWIAQQNDHHPELLIGYKNCQVNYSTHSLQGLSDLDFICARAIDKLVND